MKKVLLRNRRLIAESIESLIAAGSLVLSILLRFDFALEPFYGKMLLQALPLLVIVKIAVFRGFGLRDLAWRFIGFPDLVRIGAANLAASSAASIMLRLALGSRFPRSLCALVTT